MNRIREHIEVLYYIFFAGLLPTFIWYFGAFRALALVEGSILQLFVALLAFFTPIIIPAISAFCYFKIFDQDVRIKKKNLSIWLGILIIITALYFYMLEPLWKSLMPTIISVIGLTLIISLHLAKKKFKSR